MQSKMMIALFGEAEKGAFARGYLCQTLEELKYFLGEPPPDSQGLHFAVQSLMYGSQLLFFRVLEEGYSVDDYQKGLQILEEKLTSFNLNALAVPGVGDELIINESSEICEANQSILIVSESDLYDFLTFS